jgi:RNA-directed DNA polymerase
VFRKFHDYRVRQPVQLKEFYYDRNFYLLEIFMIHCDFEKIISVENIFRAWNVFKAGKEKKQEIIFFEINIEDNLFSLRDDLCSGNYRHQAYEYFRISDPKKRDIHKASVRDRIVHQILYDYLRELFEPLFIDHSYSSRIGKGSHRAVRQLKEFSHDIAKKNFGRCYAAKCDARKYFENIDHDVLLEILGGKIKDKNIKNILKEIIESFHSYPGKGIPLGNVTSQIFANIYLNELDQFVTGKLNVRHYVRYNDDFVILDYNKEGMVECVRMAKAFVESRLLLKIPKEKITFRKLKWGIDFCGYVVLPNAILLRRKTKKRMLENIFRATERFKKGEIAEKDFSVIFNSYCGLIKHCDSHHLKNKLISECLYEAIY